MISKRCIRALASHRVLGGLRPLAGTAEVRASGASPTEPELFFARVAPVAGKDLGVVATQDIRRGSLVISEKPILEYTGEEKPSRATLAKALEEQLAELPTERQEEVWALYDAAAVTTDGQAAAPKSKSLVGIVHSNAFSRAEDASSMDAALCLLGSRLNHSCSPNAEQSWDADSGLVQLRATCDISSGEEICNYYVDLLASRDSRRHALWTGYKFHCTCPVCELPADKAAKSDERRKRLQGLYKAVLLSAEQGSPKLEHTIRDIQEILRLLDEEGLALLCQRKVLGRTAAELSHNLGRTVQARRWLQMSLEASLAVHGPAHRDSLWLQDAIEELRGHRKRSMWSKFRDFFGK